MLMLQPNAPWKNTYENTALVIGRQATNHPLFTGEDAAKKTAALLVSLAWFESRFDPKAIGDHGKAFGLYQQQGKGKIEDAETATKIAIEQIKFSFKVCRENEVIERLGWYAAGGPNCDYGLRESRHRMLKAFWLVKNVKVAGEKNGT